MPAVTPPARMPGTAVMPPSSHSISEAILGVHRRGFEPGALVPAEHHVEVLDAVGRAALAQVIDGRHAHGAARASIGDHRDVAEGRANDGTRRRALALVQNTHQRLTRGGL